MSQLPEPMSSPQAPPPVVPLVRFELASQLEANAPACRRRLQEKERILLSAGILLPGFATWTDPAKRAFVLAAMNPSYPKGVGPTGGSDLPTDSCPDVA